MLCATNAVIHMKDRVSSLAGKTGITQVVVDNMTVTKESTRLWEYKRESNLALVRGTPTL